MATLTTHRGQTLAPRATGAITAISITGDVEWTGGVEELTVAGRVTLLGQTYPLLLTTLRDREREGGDEDSSYEQFLELGLLRDGSREAAEHRISVAGFRKLGEGALRIVAEYVGLERTDDGDWVWDDRLGERLAERGFVDTDEVSLGGLVSREWRGELTFDLDLQPPA